MPQITQKYYEKDIWEILNISKRKWIVLTIVSSLAALNFVNKASIVLFEITFSRSGFGALSFSSLVQSAIFEEFLFRGVILNFNLECLSGERASKLNGMLFGLWHVVAFFAYSFSFALLLLIIISGIFGYVLAIIQIKYKNLLVPISLHSLAILILATTRIFVPA